MTRNRSAISTSSLRPRVSRRKLALLAAIASTAFGASPARADRCEDIANQLKSQVDGLKIGITAGRIVYLSHPQAKELSLGCRGPTTPANSTPRPTAASRSRNSSSWSPGPGAIVFTIPKPDVLTGATRCIKRMGLLRGDTVKMRFRRLNMECTRTRTEAAIAITRGKDE